MTRFRRWWCLSVVEVFPEYDICEGERLFLGADALTVVLPSRERVWLSGWLRARGLAAVTLVVLGAGVSIRLLRRPAGRGDVREAAATRHVAEPGARAVQRGRAAFRPVHGGAKTLRRRRAGRRHASVYRRPGPAGQTGVVSRSAISSVRARSRPVLSARPEAGVQRVDGAPAPARAEAQSPASRRRPPCLPGTLGC
jgi:hypothetical protein